MMTVSTTRKALFAAALLGSLACPALVSPALAQALAVDTASTTSAGTPFTAPKSWSLTNAGGIAVMTAPEGDFRMAIIDVGAATDANAALAKAWARFDPAEKHALKLASPLAPIDGWDERVGFTYETSLSEKLALGAIALRKGDAWTVLLTKGAQATAAKRGGAGGLLSDTLLPRGFVKENFAGKPAHRLDPARVAMLRQFVRESMAELGVPGVGLALIDHGEIVFEGGEGIKELGKPDLVDARTLFAIASNTKGMATLLLAQLVDEGKLRWDQPVTEVYPSFRLGSDEITSKVLIKHLVCACTGLPRKDMETLFNTDKATPASDAFKYLAATEPTSGFGEVYQYNNLMAAAAGFIAGHLIYPKLELGAAFDKAMQQRIFAPLGMADSTLDIDTALLRNHASPHDYTIDGVTALGVIDGNYTDQPFRPAGGAWSSAHDMIRYVRNELTQGVLPNGRRMVSAASLLERRKPTVPGGKAAFYGMGLRTDSTWGAEIVHHGGSLFGYKSDILMIPEAQVGAVLLTNSDQGRAMLQPFKRRLIEILYDGRPEAAATVKASAARTKALYAIARKRVTLPADPAQLARLAPRYSNADLGELTIVRDGDRVVVDTGLWKSTAGTRVNDDGTVSLITVDPTLAGSEWVIGMRDGKPALITRDAQHDYVFVAG